MSRSVFLLSLAEGLIFLGLAWAYGLGFVDMKSGFAIVVILNIAFIVALNVAWRDERKAMEESDG